MNYENTLLKRIFTSISWRYYRNQLRLGMSILMLFNLFFIALAVATDAWEIFLFSFAITIPVFFGVLYYIYMLRFLKRNAEQFIYETIVLPKPKGCCRNYAFIVEAQDTYGRTSKSTRAIFNNFPSHYLGISNFVGKEVYIAHLEGRKRIYILNIVDRQFINDEKITRMLK